MRATYPRDRLRSLEFLHWRYRAGMVPPPVTRQSASGPGIVPVASVWQNAVISSSLVRSSSEINWVHRFARQRVPIGGVPYVQCT